MAEASEPGADAGPGADVGAAAQAGAAAGAASGAEAGAAAAQSGVAPQGRFGTPGAPINRRGPFYLGLVGAIGVLLAWSLFRLIANLSGILTLIVVAAFIAIGLDPLVRTLQRRGMHRGIAVAVVFVAVLVVIGAFLAAVVPTLVSQTSQLTQQLPDQMDKLLKTKWVVKLNADDGMVSKLTAELKDKVSSGQTVTQVFGGVLGAGKAVISGVLSVVEVLILSLYFLASMDTITNAGYRLVPASRRTRVRALGDEIIRRIGRYLAGQVAVAALNGCCTFILLSILGMPYSIVLALSVAVLGIIPLVGATLGAVLVALVGLFQSWQTAAIIVVYYVVYQQIENYLIAPRIMSRTVSVPGVLALVAALSGAALLGVIGALIAIPTAAAILLIVQEVLIPRQDAS